MTTNPTILALLRDEADEQLWRADLDAIRGSAVAVAGESVLPAIRKACGAVSQLRFIILSARLYLEGGPAVIATIRELHPAAEILLVSPATDPIPAVTPLFRDGIRNLVVTPDSPGIPGNGRTESHLRIAAASLMAGRNERMAACLMPGTLIREFLLTSSGQKEALIAHLDRTVRGQTAEAEFLRQRAALIADEMIENALYGAPRGNDGGRIFRKGECREMLPGERIVFRFGFDGENLAMEVTDGWGSLCPDEIIDHLTRNQERNGLPPMDGGLGLFLIWRFIDHLHVSIIPGRETVVSGHVRLTPPGELPEIKGFHITAAGACA